MTELSSTRHQLAQTLGDAEVNTKPGHAGAVSHGGTGIGAAFDDIGYNIAAAGPGQSHAYSGRWPEPSSQALPIAGDTRIKGIDPEYFATGAAGGAVAGGAVASACCCCVIL